MVMNSDPWAKPAPASDPWATPAAKVEPTPAADPWAQPAPAPVPAPAPAPSDGWGTPAPVTGSGWNHAIQIMNAQQQIADTEAALAADGWTQIAPDEWAKPIKQSELSKALETIMAPGFGERTPEYVEGVDAWPQATPPGWDKNGSVTPADFPRYFVDSEGLQTIEVTTAEELESVLLNGGCDEITADEYTDLKGKQLAYDERERKWTEARIMEAEERGRFINALNETRDQEYVVSQDGELDKLEEVVPTVTRNDATGFYIAYQKRPGILHAILAGPYANIAEASQRVERAYKMLTEDPALRLAFDNKFDRTGVYYAEIPLRQNRKGAFGKL